MTCSRISVPTSAGLTLALTPGRNVTLREIRLWDARRPREPWVARTPLADIAAFYRQTNYGLFVSLDFPSSRIEAAQGVARVAYSPHALVKAGETYTAHSLTIGATALARRER